MGTINCCKDCVPPKRQVGCHSKCKEYLKEKEEVAKVKENEKKDKFIHSLWCK